MSSDIFIKVVFIILICTNCVHLQDEVPEPEEITLQIDEVPEPEEITLQIVGVFNTATNVQERAFTECINSNNIKTVKLNATTIKYDRDDSYDSWKTVCKESEERNLNPVVIVGPQTPTSDSILREQSSIMHIPHIQATWLPVVPEEDTITAEEITTIDDLFDRRISLNFYPHYDDIALAYGDLLKYYNWETFSVLFEDDFGLMRVQKILSAHSYNFPVIVRRLDPNGDNRHIFKELKQYEESRVLIDCNVDNIMKYMKNAEDLKMVNDYQHYILTTMDAGNFIDDLEVLSANITWLSMTNFEILAAGSNSLASRVGYWVSKGTEVKDSPPVTKIKLESLLMDDIANHVMQSLNFIELDQLKANPPPTPCGDPDKPWSLGGELLQNLIQNQTIGVTGNIVFNTMGRRINYTLYVNEVYVKKRHTIGRWEAATQGPMIESRPTSQVNQQNSKNFIITSRLEKPYLDYTNDSKVEYEGFSKDLAEALFKILKEMGFNYTYSFATDLEKKHYGIMNSVTKKWNGVIGDLLSKTADLAICDLTITEQRKKVVDFSVPFMTLGISILYKKEHEVPPDTFSFLHPYSIEVWMYTATAYCVVSIILFVCSRISPADWENPQPCDKDPEELENIWNFKNCTWLTMGSIMTQGCDILPKAIGSRWVCSMWWFFALIVCQTYIAQLAASLTSAMAEEPINSVEDLAKQSKILYGVIKGGSTHNFFKNSKDKMFLRMYENMEANPVVYVDNNNEGVQMVIKGEKNGYAFFMESSSIEYKLKRNCELKKVGGELDSKDYGIAMPSNSPFRSQINMAILRLKELTILDKIKDKWWENEDGAIQCEEENDKSDVEGDLEMKNLIGAFLVLIIGLVFCLFITAMEFLNEVRNISLREQVTFKEVFIKELKASLNFTENRKPVLRNPSRAPSVANSIKSQGERQAARAEFIGDFINFEKNAKN